MARAELDAARAWGVPRSLFLGAPLPAPGEPLWTEEDRDWALALIALEADRCGGCGQPRSESTHSRNEFAYTAEPQRCHACAAMEKAARTFGGDSPPVGTNDGVQWFVRHD